MISAVDIARMSREEKLQAIEAIWADLSKDAAAVESPPWHDDVLKETQARASAGQERILDWSQAKRELRDQSG
ncbi:MAG: addiction module protein [bacterium]|nr:addiction module protein [bacterium]